MQDLTEKDIERIKKLAKEMGLGRMLSKEEHSKLVDGKIIIWKK